MRKYIWIIILSVAFLAGGVSLSHAAMVGNANEAVMTISPQTGNFNADDVFTVSIYLNTNGQNANAVAAYLNYDKTYFQAVSIDASQSVFTIKFEEEINSANGTIKIGRSSPTPGISSTNALVAKINFKALSNVSPAADNLTFDFIPGSALRSNAFKDDGRGTQFLSGVNNAKYTVGTGGPITYPSGSLLQASDSQKIYLIENNQKRWIPSVEVFTTNGYSWSSVIKVTPSVIAAYADGSNVTMATTVSIPEGGLIRAIGGIDVYIVKYIGTKKFKRLILSPSVFNSYQHLKWGDIKNVDQTVLDQFVTSDLVRETNDTKVYKLYPAGDTGEKRWVMTLEAFIRLGFDWDSIYQINLTDRNSYITGANLN